MGVTPACPAHPGLNLVYLGTPDFAATVLHVLAASRHRISLVITQPGKPQGRGLQAMATPVSAAAVALGLPVEHLPARDHAGLLRLLDGQSLDVLVTVAWGGRLRRKALAAPRLAAVNLHASLLPRWRGAAPIERALMAGDQLTGVTVIHMASELDAGDVILSRAVPIAPDDDAGSLRARLASEGGLALVRALDLLEWGAAPRLAQGEAGVTLAAKLTAADERIRWEDPALTTVNRIRALSPRPGAHFVHRGERVIAITARVAPAPLPMVPGQSPGVCLGRRDRALLVATGGGTAIELIALKPAGGRAMSGADYANGRRLATGDQIAEGE